MTEPCAREMLWRHSEDATELDWCTTHDRLWAIDDDEVCSAVCPTCVKFKDQLVPPHYASPKCESGRYNHCSCGICF